MAKKLSQREIAALYSVNPSEYARKVAKAFGGDTDNMVLATGRSISDIREIEGRRASPSKKAIEAEIQKVREEFCAKYFPKPTKSLEQLLDE